MSTCWWFAWLESPINADSYLIYSALCSIFSSWTAPIDCTLNVSPVIDQGKWKSCGHLDSISSFPFLCRFPSCMLSRRCNRMRADARTPSINRNPDNGGLFYVYMTVLQRSRLWGVLYQNKVNKLEKNCHQAASVWQWLRALWSADDIATTPDGVFFLPIWEWALLYAQLTTVRIIMLWAKRVSNPSSYKLAPAARDHSLLTSLIESPSI